MGTWPPTSAPLPIRALQRVKNASQQMIGDTPLRSIPQLEPAKKRILPSCVHNRQQVTPIQTIRTVTQPPQTQPQPDKVTLDSPLKIRVV